MGYLKVGRRRLLEMRSNRIDNIKLKFRNKLPLLKILVRKRCRLSGFVNALVKRELGP